MEYLPLHFSLQGRTVLLVGGGEIAGRKAGLLVRAGAKIRLVAPEIDADLQSLLADGHQIEHLRYQSSHLDDVVLVVAATADAAVNARISEDAQQRNIPVNVVDSPALCTVVFPAIVDRSPLLLSVGSGGGSPVLVRFVRTLMEQVLPQGLGALAQYLKTNRPWLKQQYPDVNTRRRVTERFLDSPGNRFASEGNAAAADAYLREQAAAQTGEVYLVGAGPGDADLLTLKALQLLQRADIILYDNLVSDAVLDRARRDARREFVGKRSGYKSTDQEDINEMLVRLAREGNRVVRLKGGDPFIFGRGGEEIEALIAQNIPFQVVPGITAASGCAAYAGIPLTHRDFSQSVRFVTGHPRNGEVDLAWPEFVSPNQTLVFYMGLGGLASICQQLMRHGMPADMPIAVVSKGTTPEQKVVHGNLETISGLVARVQIETPTLIIVGRVVSLLTDLRSSRSL
jgi:uroporphyrin-III C-methyltransferase / precorrin-2 dehydrogenase / sirohydrochlorin ferrochelatase